MSRLSTLSSMSTFPGQNSIPPVTLYNMQGLSSWLNNNPTYKRFFINYPNQFPGLYGSNTVTSTMSSMSYNILNVPLAPQIMTLSQYEAQAYREQLQVFTRVYAFNSNAYVNPSVETPTYYSFSSYTEMMQMKMAVSMINKIYPFKSMARGTDQNGNILGWVIPFPLTHQ